MGKVCSIVSVKGGTGKTTTAVNTAMTLSKEGFRVLVIDANIEGSNLAFHLGLSTHNIATIHDVIRKKCTPKEAIYTHPSGLNLMLGGVYLEDMNLRDNNIKQVINPLKNDFDFLILDCSSGLNGSVRSAMNNSDEVLIVTNPELPAVIDAFKIIQYCEKNKLLIKGVVVNKKAKNSDLSTKDIESILGKPILATVPDDNEVKNAMRERTPIVSLKPKRTSSKEFRNVAYSIGGLMKSEQITIWDKIASIIEKLSYKN